MATIKDVAKLAGVSPATVSRVLSSTVVVSPKTKARIEKAIAELDFRPNAHARALVSKSTHTIGVVISQLADPFFAQMASSIENVAKKRKFKVLVSTGSLDAQKELTAIKSLQAQRCEAMVVNSKALPDDVLIDLAQRIPGFVLINKFIPQISERCVWFDNVGGGKVMADHIASLGHTQIAVISTKDRIYDATHRLNGIRESLNDYQIPLLDEYIAHGTPDYDGGRAAVESLVLRGCQFSAVLCYNDAMATGVISALTDLGKKIPDDVSVVGFDDVLLAKYCMPKLTTVKYPIDIMARKATELALSFISKDQPVKQVVKDYQYKPFLVKRESATKY
ncbi:LacI family DNA-binding transcriptional regulator [Paraglaciecola chathamensis]|jgi:LacI family transcriptional regulator|uniref:Transcriptional regulator GalR n=3 Tax=Paraglaciecola chathamensis TaxID=368405 RepID=A0A8H9IH40_9ALTE|nr:MULTISPECIES: LacI family DNA-binding transcriptional regulator [Paraglaciecola]GAC06846.1 HTH-type transcriptional regulator galS [Paraglaciecola agarilytica NO2]GAC10992.1 HTH-type transcriptional regulator galS [Paraglaciecola chathamensis S18K6]GGZ81377.1 transcriptional regulator GalR [Paraglaciecola oceanifecundans]